MQYRVNLPLLIGLVVATVVVIGGFVGLYQFQKSRNADRLLTAAAEAREEGDLERAASQLYNFLLLRKNDEQAMVDLSEVMLEVAQQPRAEFLDTQRAIGQTESTLREYRDKNELRRELLDFYMSRGFLKQALDHVEFLLDRDPKNTELAVMRSECLFASASPKALEHAYKLIGFDPTTEEFDAEAAIAPNDPGVYMRAARKLRRDELEEDLADMVVERMVEANPDSGKALLARGRWFRQTDREEQADADTRNALALAPDEPSVVIANAQLLAEDERYDESQAMLTAAIEKNPEEPGLYQALADVEIRRGEYDAAMAACDRGLEAVPLNRRRMLIFQKALLQLRFASSEETRETIADMRKAAVLPVAYPDYLEARLMMKEGEWFKAAQVFEKYQSYMSQTSLGSELNIMLGMCRERLGQLELAEKAFQEALQLDPDSQIAELGRLRVASRKGGESARPGEGVQIYAALRQELAKPKSEQDWVKFDRMCEEYVERAQMDDAMLNVLRGEVFMRRKMYPEARAELIKANERAPDNLGVRRAAVKLFASDPDKGPVKALKLLDLVVKKFGDIPILRLERADLLCVIDDEDLTNQLFALTEGMEDWTPDQRVQLWRGMADRFARLRDNESRTECLRQVAKLAPADLPALLDLFAVARASANQQAMRDAQDRILKVVGSKDNPTWLYTEANRLLVEWQTSGRDPAKLEKAKELVGQALNQRGEWDELHTLKGRIALVENDISQAIESYDRAASLGRQDTLTMLQYVKLLKQQRRFSDALKQIERISEPGRTRLLGRDYAESLMQVGRMSEAVVTARTYAQAAPNNPATQLWLGRILARASINQGIDEEQRNELIAETGEAFSRAVELNPKSAESWLALIEYYAVSGQRVKSDDAIRRAQLALPEDQNPLMFAISYQRVGRRIDAEALYEQALEVAEGEKRATAARMAATFYLSPAYGQPDGVEKATPLVNQVLKDAADGTIKPDSAEARWARIQAARLFASRGTYQELLNAERLIASNTDDGTLSKQDRLLLAEILAPRPEPVSRQKAAKLLESLGENQRLSKKSELDLAKLYFALDRWQDCRKQMVEVIARFPDDPEIRVSYIQMLLQRGGSADIDLAVRQVQRLREIDGNNPKTRELIARIAHKKGRTDQAAKTLLGMLPRDASKITAEQVPLMRVIARLLEEFEDYDRAGRIYGLAAKLGGVGEKLLHAQFVGNHVDAEQGIDLLDATRDEAPVAAKVQRGLAVMRAAEDLNEEKREELFGRIRGWLDRGLREDPELVALQLQQAEMLQLERKYDESIAVYQSLLDRSDIAGMNRAIVLNNLAYLLASANADTSSIKKAREYVNEAVDFLGPGTEILDTRAVIAMAGKRYDDAIADLRLSVIDRPTATKYFHLATAYLGAGRKEEAKLAWDEAVQRGLDRETVSILERKEFDRVKQTIETGSLTSLSR